MSTKSVNFTLGVTLPPDWFLSINPTNLSVAQGTVASFIVTTTNQAGYAGTIQLAVTGLPAGVVATITPNPVASAGTATISIPTADLAVGTLALTLTGVGA
jgi:hypothetical protein